VSVRSPRGSADGSDAPSGVGRLLGSGRSKSGTKGSGSKSTGGSLLELVVIIAVAVLLALGIQAFFIKPYKIPSGSMEPTLKIGQRVLVNRLAERLNGPHVGEIAVFHPPKGAREQRCGPTHYEVTAGGAACDQTNPEESSENFIKRIVAGPGDTITIREGHVYRKAAGKSTFVREHDPYIAPCGSDRACNFLTPIKIPAGHWFMMGDNRGESDDSRFWGPVPTSWIVGGAFFTYWPPDRIGTL
jgi:signal peptidase I